MSVARSQMPAPQCQVAEASVASPHLGGRGGRCLAPRLLLLLLGLAAGRLIPLPLLLLAHKIDLKLLQAGRRAGRQAMAGCWLAEMGG